MRNLASMYFASLCSKVIVLLEPDILEVGDVELERVSPSRLVDVADEEVAEGGTERAIMRYWPRAGEEEANKELTGSGECIAGMGPSTVASSCEESRMSRDGCSSAGI